MKLYISKQGSVLHGLYPTYRMGIKLLGISPHPRYLLSILLTPSSVSIASSIPGYTLADVCYLLFLTSLIKITLILPHLSHKYKNSRGELAYEMKIQPKALHPLTADDDGLD
jgi:hypothetical protein